MSSLGDLISNVDEVISPSIFNAKTIWTTSGTNLANHDINQDVGAVVVNETGSGFLQDHMYIRNKDKSSWVDVFKTHLHSSEEDGGDFYAIKQAICKNLLEFNFQNFRVGDFIKAGTGTAVDEADTTTAYVKLTSTVSANAVTLQAGGLRLSYEGAFTLQAKYKIFETTNVIWRIGTGMSLVESAGNQAQVGFEGCLNSDPKTQLISANGTDRSGAPMSASFQNNPLGLRIDFYPNDRIVGTDAIGGLVNKTDHIPFTSQATGSKSTFRAGVKTTNESAGDPRNMYVYSAYLVGHIYDSQSGVGAWI